MEGEAERQSIPDSSPACVVCVRCSRLTWGVSLFDAKNSENFWDLISTYFLLLLHSSLVFFPPCVSCHLPKYLKIQHAYKERIRRELNRTLKAEFEKRTCQELTEAVPATETLNVEAQKERAELARQGSLADRQPPASLIQLRQKLATSNGHGEVSSFSLVFSHLIIFSLVTVRLFCCAISFLSH